jgi:hypothetical protein
MLKQIGRSQLDHERIERSSLLLHIVDIGCIDLSGAAYDARSELHMRRVVYIIEMHVVLAGYVNYVASL